MAWEQIHNATSIPASADLSSYQYHFVKLDTNGQLALASDGGNAIGVLQDKPNAAAQPGSVCGPGDITRVVYGDAVAKGAQVASDTNGHCVTAVSGDQILGYNLDQTGVANEIGAIRFQPTGKL